jgi:hypothetical protein
MQSKKYQCYNINVQTLVVYATNETKFQIGKNLPKTLCKNSPKIHGKNLLKIPCGQKSSKA